MMGFKFRKINRSLDGFVAVLLAMTMLFLLVGMIGCNKATKPQDVAYYTCPMHPQIKREQPGTCPICGMSLVPIKEQEAPQKTKTETQAGIQIDSQRVQSIGVKTEAVQERELSKTIQIQGKVAHDPQLWVAQKEYLIALQLGDRALIKSSEEKLLFLGLSEDWIRLLKKTRNADLGFHLPDPNEPSFFEAFVNQSDVELVHSGQKVSIYDLKGRFLGEGVVRSLGTMVDLESRTVRALIQAKTYLALKSNTFVQLELHKNLGKHLAIPKSAVLFEGDHNMVYVQSEPGHFVGRRVEIGQAAGDYYEIKSGLQAGEQVVVNGQFLLDSETQMRMGSSTGGHQH